jgi:ring-1,2-phenylacetyl-CoA epoxidase subunit PaaE
LGEPLTITVKRIDNGAFSRFLFDHCKVGSSLYTIGPSGFFTLPEDLSSIRSICLFAAGSGITPVFPLLKHVLHRHPNLKVYLVYSNHSRENTIFYKDIEHLTGEFPEQLTVEFLFSNAKNLYKARLGKFLVEEYIDRWFHLDKERTLFYLCGPHDYMQMITITLLREGIPADNIRKEIFNTIKPKIRDLPPDQDTHRVIARYQGEDHSFDVRFPVSILAEAKRQGILLPYSCEAGKCGTCAATCVEGKVWMSYNEVLLDKELAKGRVLTCTGFPIGGDIVIEFE